MWEADLTGGVALVFGAEGKGCDRWFDGPVTRPSRSRSPGVESLNVCVAAAVMLFEARRQRGRRSARWPRRPSTSSTATTCCTRGLRRPRELVDLLATSSRDRARAARRLRRPRADRELGALAVRSRRTRTTCSSASRPSTAAGRPCSSSPPTRRARDRRPGSSQDRLPPVPRRARARAPHGARQEGREPCGRPARPRDARTLERLRRGEA